MKILSLVTLLHHPLFVWMKVEIFEGKLEAHLETLSSLTARVASLQNSANGYNKLDFELLRIELREFEALVTQLKDSLNSSSPTIDSLYNEVRSHIHLEVTLFSTPTPHFLLTLLLFPLQIHNMTLIVDQLETYDKSNLELIRDEFAKLQKKLEECQKEQDLNTPDIGETTT